MNTARPGEAMLTDWREAAARFEREVAAAFPDVLEAGDDRSQAGRVDEAKTAEVHGDLGILGVARLQDGFTEAGGRVEIELTFHLDHGPASMRAPVERQVHGANLLKSGSRYGAGSIGRHRDESPDGSLRGRPCDFGVHPGAP